MTKKQGTTGTFGVSPAITHQRRESDKKLAQLDSEAKVLKIAVQPMTTGTPKRCDNGGMF